MLNIRKKLEKYEFSLKFLEKSKNCLIFKSKQSNLRKTTEKSRKRVTDFT
jgi:hypothetical protein